jgi:DNA-directed RNA polymerase subunit beta
VDKKDTVGVRIDRKRRQSITVLMKALGWSTDEILALFDNAESIKNTLEKDHVETQEEALEDIYRKLRPGEPPTAESAKTLLENLFFNPSATTSPRSGATRSTRSSARPKACWPSSCAPTTRRWASSTTLTRRPGSSSSTGCSASS